MSKLSAALGAAVALSVTTASASELSLFEDPRIGTVDENDEVVLSRKGSRLWGCAKMAVDNASVYAEEGAGYSFNKAGIMFYMQSKRLGDENYLSVLSSSAMYDPSLGVVTFTNMVVNKEKGVQTSRQKSSASYVFSHQANVISMNEPEGSFGSLSKEEKVLLQKQVIAEHQMFTTCAKLMK